MADYKSVNVKKMINAAGTLTKFGGSLMPPEVLTAMSQAASAYVDLNELLIKTGAYLAGLLGVGGALIVNGAAAGMVTALAACMAGDDLYQIRHLPLVDLPRNEVIVLKSHRNLYDQAIRQSGVKIREIGLSDFSFEWDLRSAFSEKTCAVVYYAGFADKPGSLPLDKVISAAQEFGTPVIVDAAAELPPVENLWTYYQAGADLVIFSGGKDLRGPQASGLIVGSKKMIDLCRLNGFPSYGIGRPCKVAKEEIMGLVTAIELYLKEDQAKRHQIWEKQTDNFRTILQAIPSLNARRVFPGVDYIRPSLIPRVYFETPPQSGWTAEALEEALFQGEPGILLAREGSTLIFNPHMLQPGLEQTVGERIVAIFKKSQA